MANPVEKTNCGLSLRRRTVLRKIHVASTIWFVLSVMCLMLLTLRQAGKSWLVIVSLSGYSAPLVFLLVSLYLFAIFRGINRSQKIEIEHPVTTSFYYMVFYVISPFLGVLAGSIAEMHNVGMWNYLLIVAAGSFWTTFFVWIITDPLTGLLEMLFSASRKHRRVRLAETEAIYRQRQIEKRCLMAEIEATEKSEQMRWEKVMRPYAQKLAQILTGGSVQNESVEKQVVDIGLTAWQTGGISCMRRLYAMVIEICEKQYPACVYDDYIPIWWDGIGSWRCDWFESRKLTNDRKKIVKIPCLAVVMLVFVMISYCAAATIYVSSTSPNDPGTGTFADPYQTIQDAIDASADSDAVIVAPGVYTGSAKNRNLDFKGKVIIVRSTDPNDSLIVAATVINPAQSGRAFNFSSSEDANSLVAGFTITGGYADYGGAIQCILASPTITNCVIISNEARFYGGAISCLEGSPDIIDCIIKNNIAPYGGGGIRNCNGTITGCVISGNDANYPGSGVGGGLAYCNGLIANCVISDNFATGDGGGLAYCNGIIINCTIAGNSASDKGGGIYGCAGQIKNCIFVGNSNCAVYEQNLSTDPQATYCCFYDNPNGDWYDFDASAILTGHAAINALPETQDNIDNDPCFAVFDLNGDPNSWDFHLQSISGRWDANEGLWINDSVTSLCIDAGDPNSDWTAELWPNGKRINMGAYGATEQASLNGNRADFNIDRMVDFRDYAEFAAHWLSSQAAIEDLNRSGTVDFADLAIFTENWLWTDE